MPKTLRIAALMLMAVLQACAHDEGSQLGKEAPISTDVLGTITMREDQNIVVRYKRAKGVPAMPDLVISPDSEAYQFYIGLVGGINPGETRSFKSYVGVAHMRDDNSIDANWIGGGGGSPVAEPYAENIKPDDPRYAALLKRVGGLSVGQSKVIPKQ